MGQASGSSGGEERGVGESGGWLSGDSTASVCGKSEEKVLLLFLILTPDLAEKEL